jgi:uncharacterized OB-fold protein
MNLDADGRVLGQRCRTCGHTTVQPCHRCPKCGGEVAGASFGPTGEVWSSTVVRIPIPGRQPPFGLAYVDLDDGPRVLAHVPGGGDTALPVGSRVSISSISRDGDLEVVTV